MTDPAEPVAELPRAVVVALSLRFVIAVAVMGMGLGSLIMFWEGGLEIWGALRHTFAAQGETNSVVTDVMAATDKFLFGIVLVIFAFTITFSFLFLLAPSTQNRLPRWVAVSGVGEMKRVFFEVILVYLAVDFVTDIAASEAHQEWTELVMPTAILLLAGAMRLLVSSHPPQSGH